MDIHFSLPDTLTSPNQLLFAQNNFLLPKTLEFYDLKKGSRN